VLGRCDDSIELHDAARPKLNSALKVVLTVSCEKYKTHNNRDPQCNTGRAYVFTLNLRLPHLSTKLLLSKITSRISGYIK
jgi:hypothetical protein